jgi:hypothetical protein
MFLFFFYLRRIIQTPFLFNHKCLNVWSWELTKILFWGWGGVCVTDYFISPKKLYQYPNHILWEGEGAKPMIIYDGIYFCKAYSYTCIWWYIPLQKKGGDTPCSDAYESIDDFFPIETLNNNFIFCLLYPRRMFDWRKNVEIPY